MYGVALSFGGVLYTTAGTNLFALDASNGSVRWSTNFPGLYKNSPVIAADGSILAQSAGVLYCYDTNGVWRWSFTNGIYGNSEPAIGNDGTIYIGNSGVGGDSSLTALRTNGTIKWTAPVAGSPYSFIVVGPDGTIVMATGTNIHAFNPDGTTKWLFAYSNNIVILPAVDQSGNVFAASLNAAIALDASGQVKWVSGPGGFAYPVLDAEGRLYYGTGEAIYVYNPDGTTNHVLLPASSVGDPSIGADGRIYVSGGKSDDEQTNPYYAQTNLFCLNLDGSTNWQTSLGGVVINDPTIGPDGTVYVLASDFLGGSGDRLYAIKGTIGSQPSPWPSLRGNFRNTGRNDRPILGQPMATGTGGVQVSVQGEMGMSFTVQTSTTLSGWSNAVSQLSTDEFGAALIDLPMSPTTLFFRIKVP